MTVPTQGREETMNGNHSRSPSDIFRELTQINLPNPFTGGINA